MFKYMVLNGILSTFCKSRNKTPFILLLQLHL